ncbi:hypothetical protein CPB84DRAFT_1847436 [Gymnopilus junonius]|uniref:RRM domain-containing protein n=1 Tax=Gymnopilus junonius TaxID=109634 RepID=A0A9P5NK40_GYMJU|nr:hypothetical protein CPB84DRAFT_1847436 [Gymnopilus junonius]
MTDRVGTLGVLRNSIWNRNLTVATCVQQISKMAPKKAKKISLNEFLGDSTLGSWADEMESLPNAPAPRIEEEHTGDRFGRREDFLSSRPERHHAPVREDIPLPTQPPYTAFIGNLAFDLTESELEQFFYGIKTKSVKIIKDRDDKPKGFGYIEFEDVEGLKEALLKNGSETRISPGRTIRVSVAEPERSGFGAPSEDSSKFDNPWRREGPLPDLPNLAILLVVVSMPPLAIVSTQTFRTILMTGVPIDRHEFRRTMHLHSNAKDRGFSGSESQGVADKEETWTIGGKFKASTNSLADEASPKPSFHKIKGDIGPPKESPADEGDWRSSARCSKTRLPEQHFPSTPPTPQLAPPFVAKNGAFSTFYNESNPFGGARPVDVTSRDREVAERIERERETSQGKFTMSRTNSRTGIERMKAPGPSLAPTVRPSLSFANVAAKRDIVPRKAEDVESGVEQITDDVAKVAL